MKEKPALEAKLLYSLPTEPDKRINYLAVLGFLGSLTFFMILGGGLFLIGDYNLFDWNFGLIMAAVSFFNLLSVPIWKDQIQTPRRLYWVSGYLRSPVFLIMLGFGLKTFHILLPDRSAIWIIAGLILGTISIPILTQKKQDWISASLQAGHLRRCLNTKTWTWDPRHDKDHIRKDPRKMRPGLLWRMLTWIGPAIGMSLADVFGHWNTYLLLAVITTLMGYLTLISILTDSLSYNRALSELESESGKSLSLVHKQG